MLSDTQLGFGTIADAVVDIAAGDAVVVVGPQGRGDLVAATARVTPQLIAFMNRVGGGAVRVAVAPEAAAELAGLAGLAPTGVVCPILGDDGPPARPAELAACSERHGLTMIAAADLDAERVPPAFSVRRVASGRLPTAFGVFTAVRYRAGTDGAEHVALVKGDLGAPGSVPVHIQTTCLAGTAFHALGCSCGERLDRAMAAIEAAGRGVVVHLGGDGPALDPALAHRAPGEVAGRVAPQILAELGVRSVRPTSEDPRAATRLEAHGVRVDPGPPRTRDTARDAGVRGSRRALQLV